MRSETIALLLVILFLAGCGSSSWQPAGQSASPRDPELFLEWEMYPDPRKEIVNPGSEIVFKLTPQTTSQRIKNITLYFGDGTKSEHSLVYLKKKNGSKYRCRPIHAAHTYKEDNLYQTYVEYEFGTFPRDVNEGEITLIIPPKVPSDDELKEMAFQDSVRQLKAGLNEVIGGRNSSKVKFALTSFKNANFEYGEKENDKRDIRIIKKITMAMVNSGYSVLEKNPQALVRLAHESVVKKDKSGKTSDQYQDSLEYGLRTEFRDSSKPFVYGAQIEGTDDTERLIEKMTSSGGESKEKGSKERKGYKNDSGSGQAESVENSQNKKEVFEAILSDRDRSLYFAKFSTADFVITIDRKQDAKDRNANDDIQLMKSQPIYFNVKFETEMIERTAFTEYAVRILERNGNIVWTKDIRGQAKDRVIPDFVKAAREKHKGKEFNLFKFLKS